MAEHERENHQGLGVFMNREIFGMVVMKQHIMIEECKRQNHQALEVFCGVLFVAVIFGG